MLAQLQVRYGDEDRLVAYFGFDTSEVRKYSEMNRALGPLLFEGFALRTVSQDSHLYYGGSPLVSRIEKAKRRVVIPAKPR
jgi:hypothetical protein